MSHEKRPVIAWLGEIWKNRSLKLTRPEQGIVIVEAGPGECGVFSAQDYPPLQATTEQKLAEKLIRDKARKEAREKKRLEAKAKKQSGREKKKKDDITKPKLVKQKRKLDQMDPKDDSFNPIAESVTLGQLPDIPLPPSPFATETTF